MGYRSIIGYFVAEDQTFYKGLNTVISKVWIAVT